MKTPTTIEALAGAIEMLDAIRNGKQYNALDYDKRLMSYIAARDAHHIAQMQDERRRQQIRELADQKRAQRPGASS